LIRKKKYLSVSFNKLVRRIFEGISQIGLGKLKNSSGLIFSDIIGQTANVVTVAFQTKRHGLDFSMISLSKLKFVIKKYADFPKYTLLPALMSSSSFLLPPLFLNKYFSAETAGYFDLAKLVLSIPLAFITTSFSSVLLQKISEKYNHNESIKKDLRPVLFIVLIIAVIEVITISIWGEELFSITFGKEWYYSGSISRIMVWSFATNFMVSTFSNIFVALRKIKIYSLWQLIYFTAIVCLIFVKHLPFISFLKIYVILETGCYILAGLLLASIIVRYEMKVHKGLSE
jgi:O-antigen/teichoic acid export membrane protein